MKTICATKRLTPSQRQTLEREGIALVDYNAIRIVLLDVVWPNAGFDHFIFTSQNAVKSYLKQRRKFEGPNKKEAVSCFCVGSKTKAFLEKNGLKVLKMTLNAVDLANYIIKHHEIASFLYLCGDHRRDVLPEMLQTHGISFEEVVVYKTQLTPKKLEGSFDGVLFFSPSGVESFFQSNQLDGTAFCIGPTTARAVRHFTEKVAVAELPVTEKLLELVVEVLTNSPLPVPPKPSNE